MESKKFDRIKLNKHPYNNRLIIPNFKKTLNQVINPAKKKNLTPNNSLAPIENSICSSVFSPFSSNSKLKSWKTLNDSMAKNPMCEIFESQIGSFIKSIENDENNTQRFSELLKFFLSILQKISLCIKPYDKIIDSIVYHLSRYLGRIVHKDDNEQTLINDKLTQKLKTLSEENIKFYKVIQEQSCELSMVKKTIGLNESYNSTYNLVRELEIKTKLLAKYDAELSDYRHREVFYLGLLDNKVIQPEAVNTQSSELLFRKNMNRSQTLKNMPRLSIAINVPKEN